MAYIHEGHRYRLKSRFSERGGESLNDIDFLELLLFYAIPRRNTNELAHRLLDRYGSLADVLDAPEGDIEKIEGLGENSALLIKLVREAIRRYVATPVKEIRQITSSADAGRYFVPVLRYEKQEKVYLMCLNNRGSIVSCEEIASGTMCAVNLNIRKIVDTAVRRRATGVVLAHNHPEGFALPSAEDRMFTAELKKALRLMEINFLDHIIVAEGDYVSFAQSGMML